MHTQKIKIKKLNHITRENQLHYRKKGRRERRKRRLQNTQKTDNKMRADLRINYVKSTTMAGRSGSRL